MSAHDIALCMIVRNEEHQLRACLESARPHVQEICIVDTGSTDATPSIARDYADKFESFEGCNDSEGRIEDFSLARNRAFGLASKRWVMWLDGDDELAGGCHLADLVARIDAEHRGAPTTVLLPYDYSHDEQGRVVNRLYRERLMSPRAAFTWVDAVHEVCVSTAPGVLTVRDDRISVIHHRDRSPKVIEPGRNLRILQAMHAKYGDATPRHLFYLGQEYGDNGDVDSAVKFLTRYVEIGTWDDERYMACLRLILHAMSAGAWDEAIAWCFRAVSIRENWGEAYFHLARCFYFLAVSNRGDVRRNWEKCVHFARVGLALPPTTTNLFVDPTLRDVEVHRVLNAALCTLGDVRGALESVEMALRSRPDADLDTNRRAYVKHLALAEIRDATARLESVGAVQAVAPVKPALRALPARKPGGLSITIYVGHGVEPWTPQTAKEKGIGGSETAVIEMAKRLAVRGHAVTVYGHCEGMEAGFDGVWYADEGMLRPHECDVLITSRRPHAVDLGIRARTTLLWVHDVHCGDQLTPERAARIDRILCLSQWHRGYFLKQYPWLDPEKVTVTRNGIDLERFAEPHPVRDPHRIVYSSSPDRGLAELLAMWPRIRARVPDATLHVFYGFETWERCADNAGRNEIAHLRLALDSLASSGVTFHGRVDQATLAREMLASGVWAYPTWFSETSCITAMEAQAAGLAIVASPIAALRETVGVYGTLVDGNRDRFVDRVVAYLENMPARCVARESIAHAARMRFGWDSLADEWDVMLRALVADDARPVLHMVLAPNASGGVVMDAASPTCGDEAQGGGSRTGFLGLVAAMGRTGKYRVRAFSTFKEPCVTRDGVEYAQLERLRSYAAPDVLFAYYDTTPLNDAAPGVLRVASHHTYRPWVNPQHTDVHTAPSQHAVDHLRESYAPFAPWHVLPNGVPPIERVCEPVPGRVIYHTSWDRGLHHLLAMWPAIRERVPGATLHVIGPVKEACGSGSTANWRVKLLRDSLLDAEGAGGLSLLGRLPRADVVRELSEASVFAFPADVEGPCETFSLSIMESCAIGLPVLLHPVDALESIYEGFVETVSLDGFEDALVETLRAPMDWLEALSGVEKRLAAKFTFDAQAGHLCAILDEHIRKPLAEAAQ